MWNFFKFFLECFLSNGLGVFIENIVCMIIVILNFNFFKLCLWDRGGLYMVVRFYNIRRGYEIFWSRSDRCELFNLMSELNYFL